MYQQAETALNTWQKWIPALTARPEIIGPLTDGLTNQNFKLKTSQGDAVLRIPHPDSESLGIKRTHEKTILDALLNKQITADIWYYHRDTGVMVSQFLSGHVYTANQLSNRQKKGVQSLIKRYQSINVNLARFDYVDYLLNYRQQILPVQALSTQWESEWQQFFPQLTNWQNSGWKPVLCHHDLKGKNLVNKDDDWLLLDWEYAAMGHPAIDFITCGLTAENLTAEEENLLQILMIWIDRYWSLVREPLTRS